VANRAFSWTAAILVLHSASVAVLANPAIPRPDDIVRCERVSPFFERKPMARHNIEAVFETLNGGKTLEPWMKHGFPPDVLCCLPPPPHVCLEIFTQSKVSHSVGFTSDGSLVYLDHGLYQMIDRTAREKLRAALAVLDDDLRKEIVGAPRPCRYIVGTIAEDSTLWAISRTFYGDGQKWKLIYDANRKTVKDPDAIVPGMTLLIPKEPRSGS
jgi:hypothetical protein